jgi:4-nitrophenyl phosphatase
MVGDRIDTDIAFGKLGGVKTCLVLTGVSTMEDVHKNSLKPDFILKSLGDIIKNDRHL